MSSTAKSVIGSVLLIISTLCAALILDHYVRGLGWVDWRVVAAIVTRFKMTVAANTYRFHPIIIKYDFFSPTVGTSRKMTLKFLQILLNQRFTIGTTLQRETVFIRFFGTVLVATNVRRRR